MILEKGSYRKDIDGLKALAIIAIVFYHLGFLTYGYLGVDVFLVISGYLITKSITARMQDGTFSYRRFLGKRILRLYPMVLLAGIVSFCIGFFVMLPDDYENLSESIIASNFFSNNILEAITTQNYWDVVNEYKPLMHTWYLGIEMQFYILFPLFFLFAKKYMNNSRKTLLALLSACSGISLLLFLLPSFSNSQKFYYLPFRFYELSLGGLVAVCLEKKEKGRVKATYASTLLSFLFLVVLLFAPIRQIPNQLRLLLTVFCSLVLLGIQDKPSFIVTSLTNKPMLFIGKISFGLYIWHQVILAFYRYCITSHLGFWSSCMILAITCILSILSYNYIEVPIGEGKCIKTKPLVLFLITISLILTLLSGLVYLNAGVVRDVPELNINKNDIHRGMHAEYNAKIYQMDKDFPNNNGKINVLVVGNSFARDWANILLESKMKDTINLSYAFSFSESLIPRIQQADDIFIFGADKESVPKYVFDNAKSKSIIYGIGTKNFGDSNGIIYKNRNRTFYYQQSIKLTEEFEENNKKLKEQWGSEHYIDLINLIRKEDGTIPVFTPSGKFISQDCRHLTKEGAKYYASIIDFTSFFEEK